VTDRSVSVVNTYRLTGDSAAFVAAARALALRVEREGHPGVRSYRFFCASGATEGQAAVTYDSAEAWVGHHDLIMGWPEMAALRAAADLVDIQLFGPVSPAMEDWIGRMGVAGMVRHRGEAVAGFRRTGDLPA
jgi:hypothetical protein